MNGVGRLIKNELIKVTHQISWKIITVLVLVFAIAAPILNYYSETVSSSDGYEWMIESREKSDGVIKEYYDIRIKSHEFFEKNGIGYNDWRYNKYFSDYEDAKLSLAGMQLILGGEKPQDVWDVFGYANNCYYDPEKNAMMYYDESTGTAHEMDQALMNQFCDKWESEIAKIEREVTTVSFDSYVNEIIDSYAPDLEAAKSAAASAKGGADSYAVRSAKAVLEGMNMKLDIWKAALGTAKADESWVLSTAMASDSAADSLASFVPRSESDFETDETLTSTFRTYDAYKKYCDRSYAEAVGAMNMLLCSIKNKTPMPEYMDYSVRDEFESSVSTNASLTLFFCMILAATIVASEHTSGTIRLLMIRPRARWKILFSKLACIVIYGLALFVAATGLSFVTSAFMHGIGEFAVPYVILSGTDAVTVNPIAAILLKVLINTLPMIVLVLLAFGLSVLMKKVVFAVAIPLMIEMFGGVASQISLMLLGKAPILKWTIIPYYNLSYINYTPLDRFSDYGSSMYYTIARSGLTLKIGLVMMAIHIVAALVISFVAWNRQQIKN